MEKLSGLVLDYYDDQEGGRTESLIGLAPEAAAIFSKQAHVLSAAERACLPSDVFALTLRDGDVSLKKFAMIDAGNTAMSIECFCQTAYKLPAEAQKVAAANLLQGASWYGFEEQGLFPEQRALLAEVADGRRVLTKQAFGLGGLLAAATMAPGAAREAGANLKAVQPAGGTIMTPDQLKAQRSARGL